VNNSVGVYGTPTIPVGAEAAVVMFRGVPTLTLSVTVMVSESEVSGTESANVMVSLSVTMAGWPPMGLIVSV
jgi:hypothetical protein